MSKHKYQPIVRSTNEHQSIVVLEKPEHDDNHRAFIPYCAFRWHQGMVARGNYVCEQRQCSHYKRLYLDGHPETPFKDSSIEAKCQEKPS